MPLQKFNYSDASYCNGGFLSEINNKKHNHKFELEVEGKNIENFLYSNFEKDLDRIDLIKMDSEGYDKEILKTLPRILKNVKPCFIAECYLRLNNYERKELYDIFIVNEYRLFLYQK